MRTSCARGFSLIELMIVLAIIMILTLLAIPNFTTWLQNSRTRSVAESLQNGLRFAQGEAARLSRLTTFATSGTGWTVTYTQLASDTLAATLQTAADGNLENVTITASPTTSAAIQFNSLGRASGASTSAGAFSALTADATYLIRNSLGTRQLKVIVSPGGKVRMCDPDKTFGPTTPDGC